mgnify:CR=1 FL=1
MSTLIIELFHKIVLPILFLVGLYFSFITDHAFRTLYRNMFLGAILLMSFDDILLLNKSSLPHYYFSLNKHFHLPTFSGSIKRLSQLAYKALLNEYISVNLRLPFSYNWMICALLILSGGPSQTNSKLILFILSSIVFGVLSNVVNGYISFWQCKCFYYCYFHH